MQGRVLILLATYNGEKYIKEQIDSIRAQTYKNWCLCISDDGSSDNTLSIINEIAANETRILPVLNDNKKHGACTNFYHLLRVAKRHIDEYDYFCLCDQDDIWEQNKIEKQISSARNLSCSALIYSNLRIMDETGKLHEKMSEIQQIELDNPANIFFNQIYVWGNTVMINKKMLAETSFPDDLGNGLSHDHYLAFQAASCGRVFYIEEPLVRYRRSSNNVSDMPHKYNILSAIKKLIKSRHELISSHAQNYNNILYFIKHCTSNNALLEDIERCYTYGGVEALKVIRKYNVRVGSNEFNKIARELILLTGVYKKSSYFCSGNITT